MDRRKFLSAAATAGGLVCLSGGFWARQAYARGQMRHELVRQANPVLAAKNRQELQTLPGQAYEKLREYFHGLCLNVPGFVDEVCSEEFGEKVKAERTRNGQYQLVLNVFLREVKTSEVQVLDRVQLIAENISRELDANWDRSCRELADRWNLVVKSYRAPMTGVELTERMTPIVQEGVREAIFAARKAGLKPAIGDVVDQVGKSALMLFPISQQSPWVGWPTFTVSAFTNVFDWFIRNAGEQNSVLRATVSSRLAYLGNRMALEFKKEVRGRLEDLHKWQDQAVEEAASREAEQLIRFI